MVRCDVSSWPSSMSYGRNHVGNDDSMIFSSPAAWWGGEAPGVWSLSGPAAQPRTWGSSCCDCLQEVPIDKLLHNYFTNTFPWPALLLFIHIADILCVCCNIKMLDQYGSRLIVQFHGHTRLYIHLICMHARVYVLYGLEITWQLERHTSNELHKH